LKKAREELKGSQGAASMLLDTIYDINNARRMVKIDLLPEKQKITYYENQLALLKKQQAEVATLSFMTKGLVPVWQSIGTFPGMDARYQTDLQNKIKEITALLEQLRGKSDPDPGDAWKQHQKEIKEVMDSYHSGLSYIENMDSMMKDLGLTYDAQAAKIELTTSAFERMMQLAGPLDARVVSLGQALKSLSPKADVSAEAIQALNAAIIAIGNQEVLGLLTPDEAAAAKLEAYKAALQSLATAQITTGQAVDTLRQYITSQGKEASVTTAILKKTTQALAQIGYAEVALGDSYDSTVQSLNTHTSALQQYLAVLQTAKQGSTEWIQAIAGIQSAMAQIGLLEGQAAWEAYAVAIKAAENNVYSYSSKFEQLGAQIQAKELLIAALTKEYEKNAEAIKNLREEIDALKKSQEALSTSGTIADKLKIPQKVFQDIQTYGNVLQSGISAYMGLLDAKKQKELHNVEVIAKQTEKSDKWVVEQKEKIEREFAKKQQKVAIMQALIDGALAIVKCFSTLGPIGGAIAAGAVAATTAMQIATIKAQNFAEGGIVPPGYPNDTYPAMLSSHEVVVPPARLEEFFQTQQNNKSRPSGKAITILLKAEGRELRAVMDSEEILSQIY
jgi:hypothetical protein